MNRIKQTVSFLLPVILLIALILPGSALAAPQKTILHKSTPPWANAKNFNSAADPNGYVTFRIYLGLQNSTAAEALASAVSDPTSAQYSKYLSPEEFRKRFAPSKSQVNAVTDWLKSQGFSIDYIPDNNRYVAAEGKVAQAQAAFNVSFGVYNVKGLEVRSPSSELSIPDSLANVVTGVLGLDDSDKFIQYEHIREAPPTSGYRNSPPLSAYWAQQVSPYAYPAGFTALSNPSNASWTIKGLTPDQIKGAYGISGYDGSGQTVAIIDAYASPTILKDVNKWSTSRGLPKMKPSQLVQIIAPGVYKHQKNTTQDAQGWYTEETLDIETVHGMAPNAKIVYIGVPNNNQDFDAAMNHVVDKHLAEIVSNSYDYPTELLPIGYIKPYEEMFIQAAIEGIGIYFSSGDYGDESIDFGFATPNYPASSPWVTAVGGTSLAVDSSNKRVFETGWGTSSYSCNPTTLEGSWLYGSGGGVSQLFASPWYQNGLGFSGRAVPDVAAVGDPQTGLLIGQTQTFPDGVYYDEYRVGGTSLSCPIFAGLMTLFDQKSGFAHGFANPLFYSKSSAFYDVTSVKTAVVRRNFVNGVNATDGTADYLRTFDDYSGSPTQFTAPGWDDVTGLGSPTSSFLKSRK